MSDLPLSLSFNPAGIELDRRQGLSLQLYQALRMRVLDGRLASGTRLPASRDLAVALAISRNSVVRAYDQLYAEGFIEGGSVMALTWRNCHTRRYRQKSCPQNYPQGFQQAYPQVYPQNTWNYLWIYPAKLSTEALCNGWKTIIYPCRRADHRELLGSACQHSTCFHSGCGPS